MVCGVYIPLVNLSNRMKYTPHEYSSEMFTLLEKIDQLIAVVVKVLFHKQSYKEVSIKVIKANKRRSKTRDYDLQEVGVN